MDEIIINGIIDVFDELDGRIDESDEFQGKLQYGFGAKGDPGVTFIPAVDDSGNISWTNDGGLPNPETKNIKGPTGEMGPQGPKGETGDSGIWIGTTPPTDPDVKVWIDTSGEDGDVEMVRNKTTSISSFSTDTQYPSAKAVYDAVSEVKRGGFLSLDRKGTYLYETTYEKLAPETDLDSIPVGACSSYVQDGKLYTNLDWDYSETASFHIICPGFEGTSFLNGLTDTELDDELIEQLPYHIRDGKNDDGIMVATHVLFNDWDIHGTGSIPLTKLPYIVLTRVKSMETIEDDLDGVLDDLYASPAMEVMEYLIQVIVTDGETTYVLRPDITSSGFNYEAVDITSNPKLTNFLWVSDETVDRADLQTRPTGVERWNMMPCDLSDLRFTKAYESPTRLSEFIGIRDTTKDSTDEELTEIYNLAHSAYETRTRDGSTWQTMHSVVYSQNGIEHLWVQENWEHDYACASSPEITTENGIVKMPDGSIGLIQAFYDYLDEKTYTAPSIASFSISGLGGTAEIGTTVSVSSMSHRELNVGFITGNLTLKKDTVTLKNDIVPSASSASVSFTAQTVGLNAAGRVRFTLSGTNSKGAAFSSYVDKTFYVPKFTGTNANATVTESDILSMTRNQNLVSAVTLPNLAYVYWITPGSITSVTNQLLAVPFVKIDDVVVTVNGVKYTYHVYRTENRLSQGSSWNFVYGEA